MTVPCRQAQQVISARLRSHLERVASPLLIIATLPIEGRGFGDGRSLDGGPCRIENSHRLLDNFGKGRPAHGSHHILDSAGW
jgi:hypothetical protein